jgi:hypothetical protein
VYALKRQGKVSPSHYFAFDYTLTMLHSLYGFGH